MKNYNSLGEIRQDLSNGSISCKDLIKHYLHSIHQHAELNVFLQVYEDEALERAAQIDEKIRIGTAGKLAGLVVGLKDVLCVLDKPLQASSRILDSFVSQFTGTAVQRLIEEDAIIIGRQNCDEFAMGSSNENSAFGPTRNGLDPARVPGGSSGASAVSVQMDMCQIALGSDTGGSVRQPASFCGVVGMKPTYSRISRHGLIAFASSFDTIGIFSKSIEDNACVLEVISGEDDFDSTVSQVEVPAYSTQLNWEGKARIGYIGETIDGPGIQPEVKNALKNTIDQLKQDGHEVQEVSFTFLDYLLPVYYILTNAEASSNLSRYDGARYGYRTSEPKNIEELYKKSRSEAFGEEVKRRIMLGTFVLSASYYDAFYAKAQRARNMIKSKTEEMLTGFDFIISPTSPTTAFEIGERSSNPLEMYLADIYTVQASVSGMPAISIPCGFDNSGMPIGMQLMSAAFQEEKLYQFAKYLMNYGSDQ